MTKTIENELDYLKTAVHYLSWVLEEGSLVPDYDEGTAQEMARILKLMVQKVEGLPPNVPKNLVQAVVVRAIVGAKEYEAEELQEEELTAKVEANMRKAELAVGVKGHQIGEWRLATVDDDEPEYEALCLKCDGVVYANARTYYTLMTTDCDKSKNDDDVAIDDQTIAALWDMEQSGKS
ncbi:MAG TPA: hypothetical protein VLL52_04510 [Anaerolineae bacterium]|nr:hypothetical protein [Anaerolineae bacterium]